MNAREVPEPIHNSPFTEPAEYWSISEHDPPTRRAGRRPAMYFYRPPGRAVSENQEHAGTTIELKLVNRIRARLAEWRPLALKGEGGVTRTTMAHALLAAKGSPAPVVLRSGRGRGNRYLPE